MDRRPVYQIRVEGRLNDKWAEWFSGVAISSEEGAEGGSTTLTGRIHDQAALRGILERIWDLNLTLISLNVVESDFRERARQRPNWSL